MTETITNDPTNSFELVAILFISHGGSQRILFKYPYNSQPSKQFNQSILRKN